MNTQKKRTRFKIRLAANEEGPAIEKMTRMVGFAFGGEEWKPDWTDIFPFWIVAEEESSARLLGVLQTCPGKPVGRLEMLSTQEDLPHRVRAEVVIELIRAGCVLLRQQGSQMASGVIGFQNPSFKKVMKRRGWKTACSGNLLAKRIK